MKVVLKKIVYLLITITIFSFGSASLCSLNLSANPIIKNLSDKDFLVLGVIVSDKKSAGVGLFKNMKTGQTFALRENQMLGDDFLVKKVRRKTVEVSYNGSDYRIPVGGHTSNSLEFIANVPTSLAAGEGLELNDDTLRISEALKNKLIKEDLSKVLMQVAAVPRFEGKNLKGFQLFEIDKGSIYELAGLKNGDLIVKINDYEITDIGMTIRLLNSMKDVPQASLDYIRNGERKQLKVNIQ